MVKSDDVNAGTQRQVYYASTVQIDPVSHRSRSLSPGPGTAGFRTDNDAGALTTISTVAGWILKTPPCTFIRSTTLHGKATGTWSHSPLNSNLTTNWSFCLLGPRKPPFPLSRPRGRWRRGRWLVWSVLRLASASSTPLPSTPGHVGAVECRRQVVEPTNSADPCPWGGNRMHSADMRKSWAALTRH